MLSLKKIKYQLLTEFRINLQKVNTENTFLSKYSQTTKSEKVSFFTSLKASITVETALVLPVFLFAMISVLYMANVIWYSDVMSMGLHQCARNLAVKAYAIDSFTKNGSADIGNLASNIALSETYVRSEMKKYLEEAGAEEGKIIYARSKLMEKGMIDLISECQVELPYDFFGIGKFEITDRARVHAFTGYGNGEVVSSDEESVTKKRGQMVMVTETGTVYHTDKNCRHLKMEPKEIKMYYASTKHNLSGKLYTKCEICFNKYQITNNAYITDYGEKYHCSLQCSALKLNVKEVALSEVGNKRLCKDCGR